MNTTLTRTAISDEPLHKRPVPKTKKAKDKVKTVMEEFSAGDLKSSSGQTVTNPRQAVAIGLSEARRLKKKG